MAKLSSNLASEQVMSTNINPMEATKSTKVIIKADSTEIDEFFVFTDEEKLESSTDGDLVFSGASKFTKTNESTTDPVINDKGSFPYTKMILTR